MDSRNHLMFEESNFSLRPGEKLEVLYRLFNAEKIEELVEKLDNRGVIGLQKFMWDITTEFGIIARKKNFSRKELTRKMTPTPQYQKAQGCTERTYYCKATQCIHANSKCARQKIKEHVKVMAEAIREYITIERQNEITQVNQF